MESVRIERDGKRGSPRAICLQANECSGAGDLNTEIESGEEGVLQGRQRQRRGSIESFPQPYNEVIYLKNIQCRSSKVGSKQSSRIVPILMVLVDELVTSGFKIGVYLRVMCCIGLVGMFNQSTGTVKG